MSNMHTTNYFNTFIQVAEDCPVDEAEIPTEKGLQKSIAVLQFEMVEQHPYRYTSDEVLFEVHASRKGITSNKTTERELYFSKGQPCFRASPLTKRYGWGVHFDAEGKMAIYPQGSPEYRRFSQDQSLKQLKAMRSKKA
jgi:hypothetical protein